MNEERADYKHYEARLIQLLRWRFEKANFKVEDHHKVGVLPLEIDLIVAATDERIPDFSKLPKLFHYFRRHNIMELKTERDRLEREDLLKLQAYGWLYMVKHDVPRVPHVTLTALAHHVAPKLRAAMPDLGFLPEEVPGVYLRNSDMVSYVISISELPDEIAPEELLAFSDPIRRTRTFLACLDDEEKRPIVETITDLYESEVLKIMVQLNVKPESMDKFIDALGREKIIAALGRKEEMMEKMLEAVGREKVIAALGRKEEVMDEMLETLGHEKILAAFGKEELLRQLLAEFGPEQLHKMIDQISQG